jgi:hypothetical protein
MTEKQEGLEILGEESLKTIMETIYRPDCPPMHRELNEPDHKHNEMPMEGQADQAQHRGRTSKDHAGSVRMI